MQILLSARMSRLGFWGTIKRPSNSNAQGEVNKKITSKRDVCPPCTSLIFIAIWLLQTRFHYVLMFLQKKFPERNFKRRFLCFLKQQPLLSYRRLWTTKALPPTIPSHSSLRWFNQTNSSVNKSRHLKEFVRRNEWMNRVYWSVNRFSFSAVFFESILRQACKKFIEWGFFGLLFFTIDRLNYFTRLKSQGSGL